MNRADEVSPNQIRNQALNHSSKSERKLPAKQRLVQKTDSTPVTPLKPVNPSSQSQADFVAVSEDPHSVLKTTKM